MYQECDRDRLTMSPVVHLLHTPYATENQVKLLIVVGWIGQAMLPVDRADCIDVNADG